MSGLYLRGIIELLKRMGFGLRLGDEFWLLYAVGYLVSGCVELVDLLIGENEKNARFTSFLSLSTLFLRVDRGIP